MDALSRTTTRVFLIAAVLAFLSVPASGQFALTGSTPGSAVRIFNTDMAVLEAGEERKDLPCSVISSKPLLGFDLRFHTGYEVSIPLKELAGSENMLTVLFRVTPENAEGESMYFTQRVRVPSIEEDAKGDAYLQGAFDIGEGRYKIEWLMRDRTERVCSSYWDIQAELASKDRQIDLVLPPNSIQASDREQFREEPPVMRNQEDQPLNLKVLINFAPQNSRSATLQPLDTTALISILRSLSRDPRVGKFTLVAFNLHEQKVVYRQDNADKIDFPALGEALEDLNLGTIDLKRLGEKHGQTNFLADLIKREITPMEAAPDAVVFAGPKALLEENVPQEAIREVGELSYPVFYMNYNLYPQHVPWSDAISRAVKSLKGTEYTISRPRDLWFAVTEMIGRIVKLKHTKRSGTSSE